MRVFYPAWSAKVLSGATPAKDAGPSKDAGPGTDAGPKTDGGPATDAGPADDAGEAPDAGPSGSDAGGRVDQLRRSFMRDTKGETINRRRHNNRWKNTFRTILIPVILYRRQERNNFLHHVLW
ncbi:MAG: hypothetical protein EOP84_21700 [Verrucomicrobiaceae bacterium]|nr:MAG: hypothetical protein EOP84_21700 [Verrucomicrobiaceae bacterium]